MIAAIVLFKALNAVTSSGQPHLPDKIDILIDQVGHFTEGLTELKLLVHEQAETAKQQAETAKQQLAAIEKQGERFDQQRDRFDHIDERLDRIAEAVEQQSHNIDRITTAMEASNRSQAEAINRLVSVVDRLLPPLP
jgi:methyl-accepting chemotaxis protein